MRLPLRSVTAVALIAAVGFAGCGDDDSGSGGNAAAADPERYCELAAEANSSDVTDADEFEAVMEMMSEAVEIAPEEIRDDVELMADATEDNAELLEKMFSDPESLSESERADLDELFADEEFTAADGRVVDWEADNCAAGDADDTTSDSDVSDASDEATSDVGGPDDSDDHDESDDTTSDEVASDASNDRGSAVADPATEDGTATPAEVTSAEGECVYQGLDEYDSPITLVSVTSKTEEESLYATYALRAPDGTRLMTGDVEFELVSPGERVVVYHSHYEELSADVAAADVDCEIVELEPSSFDEGILAPGADDTCSYLGTDDFDDMQFEIAATNPFSEAGDIRVIYGVRDADGVRFHTAGEFADAVASGESLLLSVDSVEEIPTAVTPDGITCEVLGFESYDF